MPAEVPGYWVPPQRHLHKIERHLDVSGEMSQPLWKYQFQLIGIDEQASTRTMADRSKSCEACVG